jgi:hypothetical protein
MEGEDKVCLTSEQVSDNYERLILKHPFLVFLLPILIIKNLTAMPNKKM